MNLMTRRAELRRLVGVKTLQESLAMRLRIQFERFVVKPSHVLVLARCEIVHRRILDCEITLTHRALDVNDRVTRRATKTVLRLRSLDLLLDRPVEPAIEKYCVVVTSRAPLRRLSADDVLHVLD